MYDLIQQHTALSNSKTTQYKEDSDEPRYVEQSSRCTNTSLCSCS